MNRLVPLLTVLTLVFGISRVAAANVIVVDASGGGQFTQIQPAVDAALECDTILVKQGTYFTFSIINKALIVVGDAGALVTVNGGVQVRNLSALRDVVLSNMTIKGLDGVTDWRSNALYLKSNLGSVRVRCNLTGGTTFDPSQTARCAGAKVVSCADVSFEGGSIQGRALPPYGAGAGIEATASRIALYDVFVSGGNGTTPDCSWEYGGDGGLGVTLIGSFLFASHATMRGGDGGTGAGQSGLCAGPGGDAGSAIALLTTSVGSMAHVLDSSMLAGSPGQGGYDGLQHGDPGNNSPAAVINDGSNLNPLPGDYRRISAATVVRELAPWTLSYDGQPGDEVGLLISLSTAFQFVPSLAGVKLVEQHQPALAAWLGVADGNGQLSAGLTFPELGPGVKARTYYCQAIVRTSHGTRLLGSPVSLSVLDSSY